MAFYWRDDRTVRDTLGNVVPNASVYWTQQPASTTSVPPSPLQTLYSNSAGTGGPVTNPQVTNGFGQVSAYMLAGLYTVVEVWGGKIQNIYQDQGVGVQSMTGTVTSVGLAGPTDIFSYSGTPVTVSGTLLITENAQNANTVWAGPSSGGAATPGFRALVAGDMPAGFLGLNVLNVTAPAYGASNLNTSRTPYTASIGATSQNLQIAAAAGGSLFNAATDVGKAVIVMGAGASGGNLYTTISVVNSTTSATLAAAASTTVSGAYAFWYPNGKDDTASIQAAINACTAQVNTVYLPAGVYIISSPLIAKDATLSVLGDGQDSTFICTSNGAFVGNGLDFTQVDGRLQGINLQGFCLVGPGYKTPSLVTNFSLTTNVATFTCANSFSAGQPVLVQGLTSSAGGILNDIQYTVASASGTQFTAACTNTNIASTADNAVASLNYCGISMNNARYCTFKNIMQMNWPGEGFLSRDVIVSKFEQVIAQSCAGGITLCTPTSAAAPSLSFVAGTSLTIDNCYGNGNFKHGFYASLLVYSSFSGCASDSCGVAYYLNICENIAMNGCGCESMVNSCLAYPGIAFNLVSCRAIVGTGCRGFFSNNGAGQLLINAQGATSRTTFINPRAVVSGSSGTNLTNTFILGSSTSDITIWEPLFGGTTAYTNSGSNNTIYYSGSFQTPFSVTTSPVVLPTAKFTNSTLVTSGNFVLTGFGSTASLAILSGSLASGNLQITAGGSGITANPTVTFTYPVAEVFTINPFIMMTRFDNTVGTAGAWQLTAKSITACTWTFVGTPSGGNSIGLAWWITSQG